MTRPPREQDLEALARPLGRVPESMLIDALRERLRHQREHFALVLEHLGRLPEAGEEVSVDGVRFRVLGAKDAQIQELELLAEEQPADT